MGADPFVTEIVADDGKLLLDHPRRDGKNELLRSDAVAQTVVFDVLLEHKGNREDTLLPRFLFADGQAETVTVPHDVAKAEADDVADPQAQVAFQHKGGGDALIGATAAKTFLHGRDDFFVLLRGQSLCFLVHGILQKMKSS